MKAKCLLSLLLSMLGAVESSAAAPTVFDLVGRWETQVIFGKMKFNLTVRVVKSDSGQVSARIDIPQQGARDIPVNAMLFNYPAVRWEIDPFNTAFNGKLSDSLQEITGEFEEGPGGRPIAMIFKRSDESSAAETKRVYTFADGEPRDIRGFWEGAVEQGGGSLRLGLKVGLAPDGTYAATLDLLDQGAADLPTSSVAYSNAAGKLDWQALQLTFEGKLSADGQQWAGDWKQRAKVLPVTFRRRDQPAKPLPEGLSFTPSSGVIEDIRGEWSGALTIQGTKLRIVVKIGQTPDGQFAGSLLSPDQGGGEVPTTAIGYTNPVVRLEWRGIRGVYSGKLNADGSVFDGKWDQNGSGFDLQLSRARPPAGAKSQN